MLFFSVKFLDIYAHLKHLVYNFHGAFLGDYIGIKQASKLFHCSWPCKDNRTWDLLVKWMPQHRMLELASH